MRNRIERGGKDARAEAEVILSSTARERAMRAMAEICAERGYGEALRAEVIARGGLEAEEFSELFVDEEDCVTEAVKAILGETMGVVSAAYSPDRSDWDNGLHGIKAILELMAAHPSLAQLAYIGSRQATPPKANAVYVAGVQVLCAMLDGLRGRSETSPPRNAARGGFGAAEAVIRREILAGRTEELPRLLPDLIYGATVPFIGQEDALWMARRAREMVAEQWD